MTSITITVDDSIAARALDAFAIQTGWDGSVTKAQWAKQQLAKFIKDKIVAYEADQAQRTAYSTQLALSETEIIIA